MDRRHTVHREAVMDVNVRHMHPVVLIDNLHLGILILLRHTLIQFLDDRHKLRHYLFQICQRPFFKRLRQNCVVRVSAGPADNLDRLVHRERLLIHQNTDQLRDYHGRVGVVDLDHRVIIHFAKVILFLLHFL